MVIYKVVQLSCGSLFFILFLLLFSLLSANICMHYSVYCFIYFIFNIYYYKCVMHWVTAWKTHSPAIFVPRWLVSPTPALHFYYIFFIFLNFFSKLLKLCKNSTRFFIFIYLYLLSCHKSASTKTYFNFFSFFFYNNNWI